jgi:hypothetical protein
MTDIRTAKWALLSASSTSSAHLSQPHGTDAQRHHLRRMGNVPRGMSPPHAISSSRFAADSGLPQRISADPLRI